VGGLIPAVSASIELRALLDHYDSGLLVKGLLLLEPWQRAELRRVLDLADSILAEAESRESRMSLAQKVESAVGKIVSEVERGVADVQAAEAQGAELAVKYKAEIEALAKQAEGQVAVALTALAKQLAADFAGLFASA
jgi:hypothetical protein